MSFSTGGRPGAAARIEGVSAGRHNLRVIDNGENRGKGFSVRAGISAARGERIAIIDADLSLSIEGLSSLLQALDDGADVAIGSRALEESAMSGPAGLAPLYGQAL